MAESALDPAEARARLRLIRSPQIGPVTFHRLLARFGDARAALAALPALAAQGRAGFRDPAWQPAPEAGIAAELRVVAKAGARHLFAGEADYPPWLGVTESPPPVLIARGDPAVASRRPVAVVGARNASALAERMARLLAHDLALAGHAVVSGLARGIDGAAHRGALAAGAAAGATIAVLGTGIDLCFPAENRDLLEEIAATGLVLTEYPPGTEPVARNFPARNRIIAGCAVATVVVEAAERSGSLQTARLAGELGREVMAVPGSPLDPRSRGCNGLIRDGATLVQEAADVIEQLTGFDGSPRQAPMLARRPAAPGDAGPVKDHAPRLDLRVPIAASADLASGVAALLGPAPVAVDELVRAAGVPSEAVQQALIELEIAGRLARHAGGRVSLSD